MFVTQSCPEADFFYDFPVGRQASINQVHRSSIKREADAPAAAQSIIDKLINTVLDVHLCVDSCEIAKRVSLEGIFRRIVCVSHVAPEVYVLADLRVKKDAGIPLFRGPEECVAAAVTQQ